MKQIIKRSRRIWLLLLTSAAVVAIALMYLSNQEPLPLPEPTSTSIPATPTPATRDDAIRDAVDEALRCVATFQGGDDPSLTLPFVSSGNFTTLALDLGDQSIQAEVIYAYTVNLSRELLVVPVAIGATFPDGVYRSFDIAAYGKPVDTASRQALIEKLGRGAAFKAHIFNFVDAAHKSADWQRCDLDQVVCNAAAQLSDPDTEMTLVLKIAQKIPPEWALFGWSINANNPPGEAPWRAEIP